MNKDETPNKNQPVMENGPSKMFYIGDDLAYWSLLKDKFKTDYKGIKVDFFDYSKQQTSDIQSLIPLIWQQNPILIFVDLSKYTTAMLHVIRVFSRLNALVKPQIIALTDYNQGESIIQRAVMAGVTCAHIKGAEIDAVCFDAVCFAFPDKTENHGFATAKVGDYINAYAIAKIGIVDADGVKIESHFPLTPGSPYKLYTYWLNKGMLKDPGIQCVSSSSEDLYYNFRFAQQIKFDFVEQIESLNKEPDEIKKFQKERESLISECRFKLLGWIKQNQNLSQAKLLKTLIIDKELLLYQNRPLTDEFGFVIRCQPFLVDVKRELLQTKPHMIVFNMEEVNSEEKEANQDIAYTYNDSHTLKNLVKIIKDIDGYLPFIIVFNCSSEDEAHLQASIDYQQFMLQSLKMTPDLIQKMAQMLEAKLKAKNQMNKAPNVFLMKDHHATYAEIEFDIQIVTCSENDVFFNCNIPIDSGTVYRVNLPVSMYVTVCNAPKGENTNADYYGLIHGLGEQERKELRKYINSVFFREKEAARQLEKEEVEKLKADAIQKKKEEELKKAEEAKRKEEEEKKAKEEAAKLKEDLKKQEEKEKLANEE